MASDVDNSYIIYSYNLVKIKSRKLLSAYIPTPLASLFGFGFTLVLTAYVRLHKSLNLQISDKQITI